MGAIIRGRWLRGEGKDTVLFGVLVRSICILASGKEESRRGKGKFNTRINQFTRVVFRKIKEMAGAK